jgi:hypothetical protein
MGGGGRMRGGGGGETSIINFITKCNIYFPFFCLGVQLV